MPIIVADYHLLLLISHLTHFTIAHYCCWLSLIIAQTSDRLPTHYHTLLLLLLLSFIVTIVAYNWSPPHSLCSISLVARNHSLSLIVAQVITSSLIITRCCSQVIASLLIMFNRSLSEAQRNYWSSSIANSLVITHSSPPPFFHSLPLISIDFFVGWYELWVWFLTLKRFFIFKSIANGLSKEN